MLTRTLGLCTVLAACSIGSAWAQGGPRYESAPLGTMNGKPSEGLSGPNAPQSPGMVGRWMNERMSQIHQHQLLSLKKDLQLKPEQENAWQAYDKAMNTPLGGWGAAPKKSLYTLSTPERLDAMDQHLQQMQTLHKERAAATRTLYAALNPAQQKTFDAQTRRGPGLLHCERD